MRNAVSLRRFAVAAAVAASVATPFGASAQSDLDASEAQAFMGSWVIDANSDMGPVRIEVDIADQGGKVAATVGSAEMGGTQEVTNVTRNGERLVLAFDIDAQGQYVDISLSFTPDGENLAVVLSAAAGQFVMSGVAVPADG